MFFENQRGLVIKIHTERDVRQQSLNEKRDFLLELLEIMDNFERALSADSDANDAWRRGVEAIYRQMLDLLKQHGVQFIHALGKPFDPHYHEAVSTVINPDIKDGTIVNEVRRGYMLDGKLLRPSRVQVAVHP